MASEPSTKSAAKIYQHTHCSHCGKAIPVDKRTCEGKCTDEFNKVVSSRKRLMYMMYAMMAFLAAVFVLTNIG